MDEFLSRLEVLEATVAQIGEQGLIDHFHNGNDVSRVNWLDLAQRKLYLHHTIYGANAATAANYGVFFICPVSCSVTNFQEVHQTAGSDAGAVTLTLEKLTGTQAPDGGMTLLQSTLSLKATANTVQTATITSTYGNRGLAPGDRLCLKDSGTLTAVANVTIMTELTLL